MTLQSRCLLAHMRHEGVGEFRRFTWQLGFEEDATDLQRFLKHGATGFADARHDEDVCDREMYSDVLQEFEGVEDSGCGGHLESADRVCCVSGWCCGARQEVSPPISDFLRTDPSHARFRQPTKSQAAAHKRMNLYKLFEN